MRTEGKSPKSVRPITITQRKSEEKQQDPRVSFIGYVKLSSHASKAKDLC